MTLQVNPPALDAYGDLLGKYGEDAYDIYEYVLDKMFPDASGIATEGLFTCFVNVDKKNKDEVQKRLFAMQSAGDNSQSGLSDAADAYKITDDTSASMLAELDNEYPDVDSAPMPGRNASPYTPPDGIQPDPYSLAGQFNEVDSPQAYLVTPNGGHLEPKLDEITKWTGRIGDWVSPSHWIRELQKLIVGYDAIELALKFFVGDWKVWANLCDGWQHCGRATEAMGNNVVAGWNEMQANHYWSGHAADEAQAYFRGLVTATDQETAYYAYLHVLYYAYMRLVYDMYKLVDSVVNALIDLLLTLGIADIAKIPEPIVTVIELAGKIGDIVSYGPNSVYGPDTLLAAQAGVNLPPKPDCLVAKHPYSDGYKHPSKTM